MKFSITQRMVIDAGHRVFGHERKCHNLHGHRYEFLVTLTANELDPLGRLIDFGEIKRVLKFWLDTNWDHGMILWKESPISLEYSKNSNSPLYKLRHFILPYNPTAENLALYFFNIATQELHPLGVKVVSVICKETENCSAEITIEE